MSINGLFFFFFRVSIFNEINEKEVVCFKLPATKINIFIFIMELVKDLTPCL